jgi:MFS transporter, PHS family, inorganic phosphate transporter
VSSDQPGSMSQPDSSPVSADDLQRLDDSEGIEGRGRILLTAGAGFFTDAYDLFIIGLVIVILKDQWKLNGFQQLALSSSALLTAAFGAWLFGRLADRFGRKSVYGWEMLVLAAGAIASAFSPDVWWLIAFRAILGFGVGGDYPVSSTIISEYAGRKDRGKMVALVFSAQGIGLVVGPLLAVMLLAGGVSTSLTWRLLLAAGAIPALAVFWLRRQIAETPRFRLAQQQAEETGRDSARTQRRQLFGDRRLVRWLFAASAAWFLFDFAYYGTTIASSNIVTKVASNATPLQTSAIELGIFAVFSLPAFYVAAFTIDRIGHRRLQIIGFIAIAVLFALVFAIPGASTVLLPFVLLFGGTYFFSQFGPNTTTFVIPSEIFPVDVRTTGDGIAAGAAKIGAFAGAAILPALVTSWGLANMVLIPAGLSVAGAAVTLLLPEPSGSTLEEISDDTLTSDSSPRSTPPAAQGAVAL